MPALEAPHALAQALLDFYPTIDHKRLDAGGLETARLSASLAAEGIHHDVGESAGSVL